jgi:hypothetical protein
MGRSAAGAGVGETAMVLVVTVAIWELVWFSLDDGQITAKR